MFLESYGHIISAGWSKRNSWVETSRESRIYTRYDWGKGRDREVTKTRARDQAITEVNKK